LPGSSTKNHEGTKFTKNLMDLDLRGFRGFVVWDPGSLDAERHAPLPPPSQSGETAPQIPELEHMNPRH
jgi:hypothetical protein